MTRFSIVRRHPAVHHEVAERDQRGRLLPGFEIDEQVGAEHQEQGRWLAERLKEMARSVDGVRSSEAANLGIRNHEVTIALGRQPHHREPMLRGSELAFDFMGRRGGGNEIDQIEVKRLANLLGGAQMAEMDWIEAAAEQPYAHRAIDAPPVPSNAYLSVAMNHVFVGGQLTQAHRTARMKAIGRNSRFGAETEFEAVGEPRRSIDVHRSRIDLAFKAR